MNVRTGDSVPSRPPVVARESFQGRYAGFASRFLSFVVDIIIITAIFLLVLAAISFAATVLTGRAVDFHRGDIWVTIGYVVWAFIYFARSWGANGRTAGMALFGVQVVRDDGGDVSERKAALRTLVFPLSFLFLGLGFLGIVFGDRRRALHDVIAGTTVIYCWDARAARLRYLSRN
jgi:uncharacterized RDD family membrane protein YckC